MSLSKTINQAFLTAQKTFPIWSKTTFEAREKLIICYQNILKENKEELIQQIASDTQKPLWEAAQEAEAMISKIPISIQAHKERCSGKEGEVAIGFSYTRHRPHGIVAIFGPFNFPGHLPNGHIVPALLAGNCILFKPSEHSVGTAKLIVRYLFEAGFPLEITQLIEGGAKIGQQIVQHHQLNALFFTGSATTGQHLIKKFGVHPDKMLALEMGGNNPIIVSSVENQKAALYHTLISAFISSGQRCTCARRLILVNQQEVLKNLVVQAKKIKPGPPEEDPFMGPLISNKSKKAVLKAQDNLIALGGKPLLLCQDLKKNSGYISCGIIDMTDVENPPDEEIFGPLLQVYRVKNFDEAMRRANDTKYGLSAALLSDKAEEQQQFMHEIQAGIVNINTPTNGALSSAPFGGIGISGNFRPSAYYACDYCSYAQAGVIQMEANLPEKQIPGLCIS